MPLASEVRRPSGLPPRGIILSGLVLYAPLWHPDLSLSPFKTKDPFQHSGTVTSAVWTPQGRTFDGLWDEIVLPAAAGVMSGAGTLAFWFKYDSSVGAVDDRILLAKRTAAAGTNYQISISVAAPGNRGVSLYTGGAQQNSLYFPTVGQWEYLSFRRTSATSIIFAANCVDKFTFTLDWGAGTGATLAIGNMTNLGDYPVKGTFGDVLGSNLTLTSTEDQRIYLATKWRYGL